MRWQRSTWVWSSSVSRDTSGRHLQTQAILQKGRREQAGAPGHRRRLYAAAAAAAKLHRWQPTRLPRPWDSPGKNTGVGCHFLLQCMKVKSEREVAQSCPTLSDPMDCSLPGSSVHGIFQARVVEWGAIAFSVGNSTRCLFF